MKDLLENMLFVFPVMIYYVFEALIVGFFITFIWILLLKNSLGTITYFQIVGVYWIIKMLFFDVFKLLAGFAGAFSVRPQNPDHRPLGAGSSLCGSDALPGICGRAATWSC